MDFWNWSLWILIPLALALAVLVAACVRLGRTDPKLIAQRDRYRQEALAKGFDIHVAWTGLMNVITVACWIIAGISFSHGHYGAGVLFVLAPLVLWGWLTALERRRYKNRESRREQK